ncbi:hypothetical protein PM023_17425 [Halorubrum ezzemoulense]|jgi:hypothetical protein|uniref:hypothetical protein n=1 Tax=Halorubrum ezzemoulense TaxID=337243 RepID=UPI00232D9F01|nr:hypothetical protein [Halorubrum ezzemoulense]MDB2226398.1 hypothetical protein [Halorubrum ezzemoulense]MDB2283477.1 hypothetical protein [Halorubrum ezzemoulense]
MIGKRRPNNFEACREGESESAVETCEIRKAASDWYFTLYPLSIVENVVENCGD